MRWWSGWTPTAPAAHAAGPRCAVPGRPTRAAEPSADPPASAQPDRRLGQPGDDRLPWFDPRVAGPLRLRLRDPLPGYPVDRDRVDGQRTVPVEMQPQERL